MKLLLDIIREEDGWKILSDESINHIANISLKSFLYFQNSEVELALLLTNDDHITKLNDEFRKKNKPTNVLSFPDEEINSKDLLEIAKNKEYIRIGDVACSFQTLEREARGSNITIYDHFAHMFIHSILHLLGYDHEVSEKDAEEMILKEVELLENLSIKSPYAST